MAGRTDVDEEGSSGEQLGTDGLTPLVHLQAHIDAYGSAKRWSNGEEQHAFLSSRIAARLPHLVFPWRAEAYNPFPTANGLLTALSTSSQEIVNLLKQLEEKVVATQALLSETKIGVVVGSFKGHISPEVAKLATSIVKKWKSEIGPTIKTMKEKVAEGKRDEKPTFPLPSIRTLKMKTPPRLTKTTSPVQQPLSPISPPMQKEATPPPPKPIRTHKTDGVKFDAGRSRGAKAVRVVCCQSLYDVLAFESDASAVDLCKTTLAIEEAAWEEFPPSIDEDRNEHPAPAYRNKLRQLLVNLKKPALKERVLGGQLSAKKLIGLGAMDLATEEQQAEREKILASSLKSATVEAVEEPGSYKDEQAWHAKGR